MKAALALVALAGLAGCTVGAGTSTVGIWRPKRVVDTDVCIQDGGEQCTRTVQVARDLPERSFGGGLFSWFNPGYMRVSGAAMGTDRFAIDSHYEYLRGRGGLGLGVRLGANIAVGSGAIMYAMPVTLVGHWGFERFSLYAGPGYTPYAADKVNTTGNMTTEIDRRGFHVMAGARVLLKAGRRFQLTSSVDVFRQYLDDVVATSVTAAFGIHL
jgi:hypothetical protein